MANHYEYNKISEKAKDFATAKLNENPLEINDYIESFRRVVKSWPHITCPTDSGFLLRFLRVAKFNEKKAEERLDDFCTARQSIRGVPESFKFLNIDDPIVAEYLDKPIFIPLGITEQGEMVHLIRAYVWNPDTIPVQMYLILRYMTLDIVMEAEETQIYGIRYLVDLSDMLESSLMHFSDKKVLQNLGKLIHECYPIRFKGEVFYNHTEIFDDMYKLYHFHMKDKMKRRTSLVQKEKESIADYIPGVDKVLPTEYGGQAGPISALEEKWKHKFREYYKNGDPLGGISVDESKRPEETLSYLIDYILCDDTTTSCG